MKNQSDNKLEINKTTIANLETTSPPSQPEDTPDKDIIKQPDTALIKPDLQPAPPAEEEKP
ncbi:hypothetical protein [Chitinophaga sp. OAE865]|uniref:hypothetical protein n=1 Tax=Chitinophaga sp. OAE865 TaxID=2817898 RepID=UPI001AE50781